MAMWHLRVCATSKWWIFSTMAQGDEALSKNKLYRRVIYWNNTLIDFLAGKIKVPHVRLRVLGVTWRKNIYKYPKGHFTSLCCLSKPGKKSAMGDLKGIELGRWYWHLLECSSYDYYYYDYDFGKMKLLFDWHFLLCPFAIIMCSSHLSCKGFSPAGAVFITYF